MYDLSNGWYATLDDTPEGRSLTVRNPDKGQRVTLSPASTELLKAIFKKHTNRPNS